MSTPQHIPNGARRSAKKANPAHAVSIVSENEASDYLSQSQQAPASGGHAKPRRKSHAKNTHLNYDSATHSDGSAVRNAAYQKTHATPVKQQAYAGPTFHQSPAASALPMPSFYSKSLPNTTMMAPVPEDSRPVTEQGVPGEINDVPEVKRESTPLDFLFEAARKAHATPTSESPQFQYLSPGYNKSPSRSPAPREPEAVFPFEMDTNDKMANNSVSASSTPFKDRLEAARPIQSSAKNGRFLDETERKAKTAALKSFLLNSAQAVDSSDNPFNARPAPHTYGQTEYQHRSNPTTPMHDGHSTTVGNHYFPPMHHLQPGFSSPSQRPYGSNLRNIYAPDSATHTPHQDSSATKIDSQIRASAAHNQTPPRQNHQGYYTPPAQPSPSHHATPSAQQLEDDLRRFLKLDSQVTARY